MFIAQAHSFGQQARLAVTLAWIAGYTNILTIITLGTVTSHVSGTTSNLGRDIAIGAWDVAGMAMLLLATFYAGAVISALSTEMGRRRGWESIYILPIALQTLLLLIFCVGLRVMGGVMNHFTPTYFLMITVASMAMGLQNATITRISSGVVRTTHVTGVLTDLGIETALAFFWLWDKRRNVPPLNPRNLLRSLTHHPSPGRLLLLGSIMGSFALGAALGTIAHELFPREAMVPPVLFLGWIIFQDMTRPIAEIEQSELMAASQGLDIPATMAIFHMVKDHARKGRVHRMPNLIAWAERLPARVRVVILDLGHEARLDKNAALDLRAVIALMKSQGRRLILAGLNQEEYAQLASVAKEALEARDVCPDMEMALIHAIMMANDPTPEPT